MASKKEDAGSETASPKLTKEDTEAEPVAPASGSSTPSNALDDRKARFAALKARNADSRKANLAETKTEHSRQTTDTSALASLNRRKDAAAVKLLKADTEAAGEDFERKRAWDWTIDESEKWDKHLGKKARHKEGVAFQNFGEEAGKVYKRQLRTMNTDRDAYEQEKADMIERAAQGGGLEIVETADGELIAVDREGKFYSTADSTDFVGNKPSKDAIDRLVGDLQRAEDTRLKKYRQRRGGGDEEDVSYINDQNKHFNQKLARFYNHYTKEIRDSFERGTAL